MDDQTPAPVERLERSIEAAEYDDAVVCLRRIEAADDGRKSALRTVRDLAADRPELVEPLLPDVGPFLTDEERSVRLTAAKLFVTAARAAPSAATDCVDTLAARVADEEEFYYVRARSAEALGYVALERPAEVATPELLADLRIGLSFDEPEVREKLAKALASVAMGDPGRLRHHASTLADHLDDEQDLVRYHLCTALAAIGCQYPTALSEASAALEARLDDEEPYVGARAAEVLGLLARADPSAVDVVPDEVPVVDEPEPFVADRLAFVRDALAGEATPPDGVGTVDAVRETAAAGEDAVQAPDGEHDCPHCGLSLSASGPPTCPRCGAPR